MGCGASTTTGLETKTGEPYIIRVNIAWETAKKTCKKIGSKSLVMERSGWRTVRIFVSSTFKDFHAEREILVKQVFPDLRQWCESRNLHLIDCDLRWGVPKDSTTEQTLRICLEEIDRCFQENVWPFFVNMSCERLGWIPEADLVPSYVRDNYNWIDGLSVTEMEIIHAAYRIDNPNALFMLRDTDFIQKLPDEVRSEFTDLSVLINAEDTGNVNDEINFIQYKLKTLKEQIHGKFKKDRVFSYKVDYSGQDPQTGKLEFTGLESFSQRVYDFFKTRIEKQYPLKKIVEQDPFVKFKSQHESFMKNRSEDVLGRKDILDEIEHYMYNEGPDTALLILGNAGSGKSSIIAKSADNAMTNIMNGKVKKHRNKDWNVFCHFVGAVPGSTDVDHVLERLIKEITGSEIRENERSNIVQVVSSLLANESTPPTIIIFDALNQLDEEDSAKYVTWLPRKLSPSIRVVLSMINDTTQATTLAAREPRPKEIFVKDLDESARREIVTSMLGKYNKRLDDSQMNSLLAKHSSHNPLWLSIACEELRVFGRFREISAKIETFADGLLELEGQVLERFEAENGGKLLVAAVCLIEQSNVGLLETELLSILAHDCYLEQSTEKSEKDSSEKKLDFNEKLPAFKWAEVFRALRPFVRPFGDSGDGRLDFYHRSLSKAVRRRYLEKKETRIWWHNVLADYFINSTQLDRKIEELPVHLIETKRNKELEQFLSNWVVFETLYDPIYSKHLLDYWRMGIGFERMGIVYYEIGNNLLNENITKTEDYDKLTSKLEMLSVILAQCGKYDSAIEFSDKGLITAEKAKINDIRMGAMYYLSSYVRDEKLKLEEYMYRSQLPIMKIIIENFEKATSLWKGVTDKLLKNKLGRTLNRLAFYYSGYSLRGGDDYLTKEMAIEKASERVKEAIEIFTELNDKFMEGDCWTTKGVVCGRANSEQLKCYTTAEEMLILAGGQVNIYLDRLYLNIGIYYEESGYYLKAYDYFYKWYNMGISLYGINHPRNKRCINTLNEPMYKRIANEKGVPIPSYAVTDENNESNTVAD